MLDEKTIFATARLAKLKLTVQEAQEYEKKFEEIFTLFAAINREDISALQPLGHPLGLHQPLRADEAIADADPCVFAPNAPEFDNDYFKVPKVIEP